MSGGGQQPVTTTTQTNTPWGPVAGGFSQTIPIAEAMQASGTGYNPYPGPFQAPVDPIQIGGENTSEALAEAWATGSPMVDAANATGANIINSQGITPGIAGAISGLGQVGTQYNDIYNQAGNLMGATNPYLEQALNTTVGNQINSAMAGAGRYGSGAQQEAIAAGEAPALAQDWQARQQLGLGTELSAAQGLGQVNQATAGIYQTGLGQAGQWGQLAPTLQQSAFMPSQVMQQIGNYYTQRAQDELNSQIQLYNQQQAYPWEQLARENAIIGGAGGLGGTTTGTSTTSVPLTQRLLGGALVGGGLGSSFGPMGTGLGAVGGALAGGFL